MFIDEKGLMIIQQYIIFCMIASCISANKLNASYRLFQLVLNNSIVWVLLPSPFYL